MSVQRRSSHHHQRQRQGGDGPRQGQGQAAGHHDHDHDHDADADADADAPVPSPMDFILTHREAARVAAKLRAWGAVRSHSGHGRGEGEGEEVEDEDAGSNDDDGVPPSSESAALRSSHPPPPPRLSSPRFWLHDANLPHTTRTAIRSALLAASVNSAVEAVGTGMRRRKVQPALRRLLSAVSLRLFACVLVYVSVYRSALRALLVVRARMWHDKDRGNISSSSSSSPPSLPLTLKYRQRIRSRMLGLIRGRAAPAVTAALAASPLSLAFLPSSSTFPVASLALWLLTHSLSSLYNEGRTRGSRLVKWIPAWCDSSLLYALGNGQLLWAFLFERDAFPRGYGDVILSRSSTYITPRPEQLPPGIQWPSRNVIADHVAILATPRASSSAFPSFTSPLLSSLSPAKYATSPYEAINPVLDYAPAHPAHTNLMCALLHPREPSCRRTYLNHFKAEWLASARFAGAFAALASILFRSKAWSKDPETEIFKVAVATLQGATVISGSIGTAWAMTCALQQYLPRTLLPRARFFLNGFVSGVFILAVPKSRRRELGLYVARMSALSSWKILQKQGRVKDVPRGAHAILALALALLAGLYEVDSQHLSKATRGLAGRVFGERVQRQGDGDGDAAVAGA